MNEIVRLAIVDPDDGNRSALKNLLVGIEKVWLEAESSRYDFFTEIVTQTKPNIAIISLDADPVQGLTLIKQVSQELPSCCVLVTSSSQESTLILQAMRNGAREFLNAPPTIDDLLSALDRIQNSQSSVADGKVRGSQVISITGVGGGVGCTSLGINLACMLAQNPNNTVAIVDLDFALGDADVWLDIIPDYTIQDVAENITRLDYSLLKRSLTKHQCGVYLLPRPVNMYHSITPDELKRVIGLLKATFTHVFIDLSKSFSPLDIAALEASDATFLITQLDLPCLRNVVRVLQFFEVDDSLPSKVRIMVNRHGLEDAQISLNKAVDTIGQEVFWQFPNDYLTMVESRNNGIPLLTQAPKAKLTRSLRQLADSMESHGVAQLGRDEPGKKPFWKLFAGSR